MNKKSVEHFRTHWSTFDTLTHRHHLNVTRVKNHLKIVRCIFCRRHLYMCQRVSGWHPTDTAIYLTPSVHVSACRWVTPDWHRPLTSSYMCHLVGGWHHPIDTAFCTCVSLSVGGWQLPAATCRNRFTMAYGSVIRMNDETARRHSTSKAPKLVRKW